jgi:microsomal epoxide hydrolase
MSNRTGRLALLAGLLAMNACTRSAPTSFRSGYFTTSDGVRLHYLEAGAGSAIVFVPGWTMPGEIWEHQMRHFAANYRVVAMDPRSQGDSDRPTEGHYPERRAQDVKELVERLGLAPAVLVGWSLAVAELLTYVDRFGTGTIRALVLVDGMIGEDPDPARSAQLWAWLKSLQTDRKRATESFVRGMYRKPHPESYYERIVAASLKTPTNTAVTLLANVFSGGDWRPVLGKLDRPLLYVVTPQLRSQAEMVQRRLPSARVVIFEQAGHALFVDEPERFNRVLEEFLRQLRSGIGAPTNPLVFASGPLDRGLE